MSNQMSAAEGSIVKGAETVAKTQQSLNGHIKSVEGQMQAIGSQWQGNAAVSFQQLMAQWNEQSRKVTGALTDFENNLRTSSKQIDARDEEERSSFASIANRLS